MNANQVWEVQSHKPFFPLCLSRYPPVTPLLLPRVYPSLAWWCPSAFQTSQPVHPSRVRQLSPSHSFQTTVTSDILILSLLACPPSPAPLLSTALGSRAPKQRSAASPPTWQSWATLKRSSFPNGRGAAKKAQMEPRVCDDLSHVASWICHILKLHK